MKKYKSCREIFQEMFTEPGNKVTSLFLVLAAVVFVVANVMECWEFQYTHDFPLTEYIKDMTVFFGTLMTIYNADKLGQKYMDKNSNDNPKPDKSDEQGN